MPNDARGRKGGGVFKLSAAVEQVPGDHRHSWPHITLSMWTVYVSSSFTYTERFIAAKFPLIPLHTRLTKRARAQAKAGTGTKCIWGHLRRFSRQSGDKQAEACRVFVCVCVCVVDEVACRCG